MEITQPYFRSNSSVKKNTGLQKVLGSGSNTFALNLIPLVLVAGIGLRLFHFIYNRSLWTDEIYLASSLIRMSYQELTAPLLDYEQKAPIGFLWLVRTCVLLFGTNEMALRLISFITSICSLLLFAPVCRHFLKPLGALVALSILAFAPPLVNYAVEVKQYGMELLVAIIAFRMYMRYQLRTDFPSLILWGLLGALLIWFSYSAIFVLAGMATTVSLSYLFSKKWLSFIRTLLPFTLWVTSFAVWYFLFTHKITGDDWLVNFFRFHGGFMAQPPWYAVKIGWFANTAYQMLYNPLGLLWNSSTIESRVVLKLLKIPIIGLVFIAAGALSFARFRTKWFFVMALPLALHLFASWIEKYPFMDRFIVYATPFLLIFMGRGIDMVNRWMPNGNGWRYVFPLLVLAGPVAGSAVQLVNPIYFGGSKQSTQREALLHINEHYQEGDVVYAYWNITHAYKFYRQAYGLKYQAIEGRDVRYQSKDPDDYFKNLAPDFSPLAGKKRVWVVYNSKLDFNMGDDIRIFPHWYGKMLITGGAQLAAAIGKFGQQQKVLQTFDADVRLYDFSAGGLVIPEDSR